MRLLLISSSRAHPSGYLDHCQDEILDFLGSVKRILFVPFALRDHAGYAGRVRERMERMGIAVDSLHQAGDLQEAVSLCQAIFVGGGNTFRLLNELYARNLLTALRARVAAGAPYIGASAGTNVACISIKTTNDMPIVYPPGFEALSLVPFNVNPHYLDPDPASTHMGETREERIREFHEMNSPPVLGLREAAMLRVEGPSVTLKGSAGARLFLKNQPPREIPPGAALDFLLTES
jgi:dipeptidase E